MVSLGHARHQVVKINATLSVHQTESRLDLLHPQGRPHDQAGQSHATDSGPKEVGLRGELTDRAIAAEQVHGNDMAPEAAVHVMVLPMDVRGDRSPDRHLPSTRAHRHKQPKRQQSPHQLIEACTGLDADQRRVNVDR